MIHTIFGILGIVYIISIPTSLGILVNKTRYWDISDSTMWILGLCPILNTVFILHVLRSIKIRFPWKCIKEIKEIFNNEQKQKSTYL